MPETYVYVIINVMKNFAVLIAFTFIVLLFTVKGVYAENLSSQNYILKDPEVVTVSGSSDSSNYSILIESAPFVGNNISSSLYKTGTGQGYTFMANVPKISCLDTSSDGTSSCTLPSGQGMVQECGEGGCYDRAKIEIDAQNNPTDTLYIIEISFDNWTTVLNVDGTTHSIETSATKTIADYKTKADWEGAPYQSWNILGLTPNEIYAVRIRALNGDFTESGNSPVRKFKTSNMSVFFDIDIGATEVAESNPPYVLSMGTLSVTTYTTPTDRIYVDLSTNARSGTSIYVEDLYAGLYSTSYTIPSATEDLSLPASEDGYGLKVNYLSQATPNMGYMRPSNLYSTISDSLVGVISQSPTSQRIFCSHTSNSSNCDSGLLGPVLDGRGGINVLGRATINTPAGTYIDTLTFTAISTW